ncbi:MAG: DUF5011 domain-containing protein, partial [Bacilli bacterium]
IKPQITLKGNNPLYLKINEPYIEPGYIATDNYEGDVTKAVLVTSNVNTNVAGVYNVNYAVQDDALNYNSLNRQVYVGTTAEISANTYIAVSIENQYIWFYKNGIVITSAPIVSGTRNRYDTPRGTYQILSKATSIYLTGPGYKSYVNYWLRFTSSQIGLHDAPWRSYFGGSAYIGNGSHGCVNLPYYTARIIYQNAPIGTRVVVY